MITAEKMKILAIDDGQDTLDTLDSAIAHAFPSAGFLTATDGLKGINLALAEDPDMIFLDISMPGMDGFEVCRRLKEDARLRNIPVAFLTALKPDEEIYTKAFEAGAELFIVKPLELWELTAQIRVMAKIKADNILRQAEHDQLETLAAQRTRELTEALATREKTLELLKESEALFKTVFTAAPMGICMADSGTGKFLSVNPMFSKIVGRTAEELAAVSWQSITHPDDIKTQSDNLAALYAGNKETFQLEKRYLKPGGAPVWVCLTATPLPASGGSAPRYLGIIEDISAAKAAEQEKKKLEEQFRQSQKMETAGSLAGGIAHDFNNILTAILSYCEFLLKSPCLDAPSRADAEEIKKAGLRAAALTRQLLIFSRKQVVQPKVLDVNKVILGVKTMLGRLIGENIKLTALTSKTPPLIKADPGYIEQVLLNLSVNARDAMPKGGKITIEASVVRMNEAHIHLNGTVEPGDYIMLSVSDTGTGMSAATQSRLFEPFFTTKPRDKGTGLGLSTVHGIIKQSGGSIVVYSEEGHGTVFKLYFPQVPAGEEITEPQKAVKNMFTGTGTVMVVDDDVQIRTLVRRTLAQDGFTVLEAASAEEALAICKRHKTPVHLIVTDMVLPKMSGFELAERLKTLHPDMKMLFMSGYTEHAVLAQSILNTDRNFLQKPFALDVLTKKTRVVWLTCPPPPPTVRKAAEARVRGRRGRITRHA
ncbi:MAG: response regulator [Elusimicrobiota bacterium]|nr:response regulator [Elusimicrobiota bacterium]